MLPEDIGTEPFIRSVVASAAVAAGLAEVLGGLMPPIKAQLGFAHDYRWTRDVDIAEAFTEPALADIVFEKMRRVLGRRHQSMVLPPLRDAIAAELADRIHRDRGEGYFLDTGDPEVNLATSWLLRLADPTDIDAEALAVAGVHQSRLAAGTYRYDDAIRTCQTALASGGLGPDHPDTLTTRGTIALWNGEAGRVDTAIDLLEALLADQLHLLGPDHPDTLTTATTSPSGPVQPGGSTPPSTCSRTSSPTNYESSALTTPTP